MTDQIDNPKNEGGATETEPTKSGEPQIQSVDFSKLDESSLMKALEDPRIWKTKRLAELKELADEAKRLKSDQQKAEEARLIEEGKYKELTEKMTKERDEAKQEARNTKINAKLQTVAVQVGAVDPDIVAQLVDKSTIQIDENGQVTGVDEAVKTLLESKPYLKGATPNPTLGSPSNPAVGTNHAPVFKHSQITDTKFYREHEAEILQAMKDGRIEHDL